MRDHGAVLSQLAGRDFQRKGWGLAALSDPDLPVPRPPRTWRGTCSSPGLQVTQRLQDLAGR